ncbi:hypothetical protein GCM10010435_68070 [Winogradskya consettensis]|uniref:Inositolphosphotransferase Aur1/Ipt1 domain-containing protein n=1 Tax=Winogradskya consettensis TaxID=113560 RepID=A0A919VS05_9ACTN|nr:flippase-like domain-containing protein [Actinoplanes consettensis]GIM73707.1 hypothetical protein Aco04nite_36700 [Actinoplanes consettensis]
MSALREVTGRRWPAWLGELGLVAALFLAYKAGRILTAGHADVATANAAKVWHLERLLHLPSELAVQNALVDWHWLLLAANHYYAYVHFPATAVTLIWLYMRRPGLYLRTRRILALLTATAFAAQMWFPLAPPRLTPGTGLLDTGTLYGPAVYGPPDTDALSNQYAAMPSLHVGWAVVVAGALFAATRNRWRWLWFAHPLITLLVVVGTGNHYWLDAIVAVALLALVAIPVLGLGTLRQAVAATRPQTRRYALRVLAVAVAGVAVVVAMRGRVPDPGDVIAVLADADVRWLAVAVLVQFLSQVAFARQQRALLTALDVVISRGSALAITYTRSAISMVLPAGAAMSAAFALRQYRRRGASVSVAATVMVLSGLASIIGLAVLYAGTAGLHTILVLALAAATLTGLFVLLRGRSFAWQPTWRWAGRALDQLRGIIAEARSVRARHWAVTITYAVLNWLADLCCLIAVAHACGLPLSAFQLATAYLAVQVVRQIPVTPGGIGLIEASLLAGLVAAGAPYASATAVVLGYRLISFWLVLPAGLLAYLRLNRTADPAVVAV